ncbi:MAG: hypothetical protein V3T83_14730, partial [Acidobacteriota bacterium]
TWRLTPQNMALVLDEALRLDGNRRLKPVTEGPLADVAWELPQIPWPECRRYLHDGEVTKKLVFMGSLGVDDRRARRKDVELLHLDHPIVRRALSVFRSQLWAQPQEGDSLSRISYKVVAPTVTSRIHLIALARMVAINSDGYKVHEELLPVGGAVRGTELEWASEQELERLMRAAGSWPQISTELAGQLRKLFAGHQDLLHARIEELKQQRGQEVRDRLEAQAAVMADSIEALIKERSHELKARIKRLSEMRSSDQYRFDFIEQEVMDEDLAYLKSRLEGLGAERRREPEAARKRLKAAPDGLRMFPLALLYILPEGTEGVLGTRDRGGAVRYEELYGLLHDFERYLREAIQLAHPEESWKEMLPAQRLEQAYELQQQKGDVPLLLCLYLFDFIRLAGESAEVRRLLRLPDVSKNKLNKMLGPFERLRNPVMHHSLKLDQETLEKLEERRDDLAELVDTFEKAAAGWEGAG